MTRVEFNDKLEIADEIVGISIGMGYESVTIGIDTALEVAEAILLSDWLRRHDEELLSQKVFD